MSRSFAGTGGLVRLVLRRDRVRLAIWVVVLVGLVAWTAGGIKSLYTEPDLAAYALVADGNATIIALSGPTRGLDTFGGRIAFEVWQLSLAFGLLGLLTVTRHTRHEEEAGRTDLLRAAAVGRHAGSLAAVLVATGVSLVVGLGSAVALAVQGLDGVGSLLLGLALASIGWAFAAIALLVSQVTQHGRGATGLALAVMGLAYLLRAVGDIGSGALSWASPFGWAQATFPFTGDRWWPLVLSLAVSAGIVGLAIAVEARRDVGAGLVTPRPGPDRAAPALGTPLGLAWRVQRATLLAWTAGAVAMGALMGTVADSADEIVGDNQQILEYLAATQGATLDQLFLATIVVYLALLAAGYAVQSVLRVRTEETTGRGEVVLATTTSRRAWAGSHVVVALGGAATILVTSGAAMGLTYGLAAGDLAEVLRGVEATLVLLPAVAVIAAAAVAATGLWPRATAAAWALLALAAFVGMFGQALQLPRALVDLSPLAHVPAVPAEPVAWLPLAILTGLAALLIVAGAAGLDRRDIG